MQAELIPLTLVTVQVAMQTRLKPPSAVTKPSFEGYLSEAYVRLTVQDYDEQATEVAFVTAGAG